MNIAVFGYGNLGRAAELALQQAPDLQLTGIFTRRPPASVHPQTDTPVYPASDLINFKHKIDALLLCAGSAHDLPEWTPKLARDFNLVDAFDTHTAMRDHFRRTDEAARATHHTALIAAGWDPGILSLARLYAEAFLPDGRTTTFWGPGVSQGHSDAVRKIDGVLDAREITVPNESARRKARRGAGCEIPTTQLHRRICYVTATENADRAAITRAIRTMPGYFAGYDTEVVYIDKEEMERSHSDFSHRGEVVRTGRTGRTGEHRQTFDLRLDLDSNPELTAGVLVACARAVSRMAVRGEYGCRTLLDIPPTDLLPGTSEAAREEFL